MCLKVWVSYRHRRPIDGFHLKLLFYPFSFFFLDHPRGPRSLFSVHHVYQESAYLKKKISCFICFHVYLEMYKFLYPVEE